MKHGALLILLLIIVSLLFSACTSSSSGGPSGPPYPSVMVQPATIDFDDNANQRILSITNVGAGTLEWEFVSKPSWIVTDADSGEIFSKFTQLITIDLLREELPFGSSTGEIELETNGGDRTIPVIAEQSINAVLGETPDSLDFGSVDDALTLTIFNTGWEALEWTLEFDNDLFSASVDSGMTEDETTIWIYFDREESPFDPVTGTLSIESNGGYADIVLYAAGGTPPGAWLTQAPDPTTVYNAQPWDLLFITRFDRPFGWTEFTVDSIALLLDTAPAYYDLIQCFLWPVYQDSWGNYWPDLNLAFYSTEYLDPFNGWSIWVVDWPLNLDHFAVGYLKLDNIPFIFPNPYIDGNPPFGTSWLAWQQDANTILIDYVPNWDWCIEIHVSSNTTASGEIPEKRWLKPEEVVVSGGQQSYSFQKVLPGIHPGR